MVRNRAYAFVGMVVLGLAVPSAPGQMANPSRLLTPYVDEQTVAVVRIDVPRVDVDALFEIVMESFLRSEETASTQARKVASQEAQQFLNQRVTQFKAAGGRIIYAMWNTANIADPVFAVPITPGANESALAEWMDTAFKGCYRQIRTGSMILASSEQAAARWQENRSASRPELDSAMAMARDSAIQVLFVPNMDARRVCEAILPMVSNQRIRPDGGAITRGLQWGVLTIDPPPRPSLSLHIESADSASALALQKILSTAWELVGQIPELKQDCPNLREALKMLMPAVRNNTLQFALDEKQCTDLVADFLVPVLARADEARARITCETTLNGMGKALLIYANDYEDKWPPTLEALVDKAEFPRSDLVCPAMRGKPGYASYVYRGVDSGGTSTDPDMIMVHDKAGNHEGGRNVVFVDTHVEWVTEERFQELIARDNRLRRQRGLPEKPAQ